jgi:hypothetical protein
MSYPSPPPSPPPYADTSNVFPPGRLCITGMDHLFGLRRGLTWDVRRFCRALHGARSKASQFGVLSIQHRKRLHQDYQHEFLILDVVPLVPGTDTPQSNAPHTLIEVGRVGDKASFFSIWGVAVDEVSVLLSEDEASILQPTAKSTGEGSSKGTPDNRTEPSQFIAGELLATLSWELEIPNLLDVFLVITTLSLAFPNYNIFTCQCFWLARAIYETLRHGYRPSLESTGDKLWKRARFLMFIRLLTPKPPAFIFELCFRAGDWTHLASLEPLPSSSSSAQP